MLILNVHKNILYHVTDSCTESSHNSFLDMCIFVLSVLIIFVTDNLNVWCFTSEKKFIRL